jgi:hypothetical protein
VTSSDPTQWRADAIARRDAAFAIIDAKVADMDTATSLITTNGWDGLTANQRKAIMLGVVADLKALALDYRRDLAAELDSP